MPGAKLRYMLVATVSVIILLIVYSVGNASEQTGVRIDNDNNEEDTAYDPSSSRNVTYKLFDLNFYFVLNNKNMCDNNSNILTLIMVTSYFGNVETRSAMRRSFSREDLKQMNIRRIFLLGESPDDKYTTQKSVEDESRRFGDIIQGSFREAYRNLTYKHVMGLLWARENCPNTKYVIKMDDDIVVNIERLPALLNSLKVPDNKAFIGGYILRNMIPIREPANKWYVTQREYSLSSYPVFVSGWLYITTPETCNSLFKLSANTKYFWIDDTYVTGILAKKLKVRHYDISKYFTVHSEFIDCCIYDIRNRNLDCDILVGPNGGNNNLFYDFNMALNICTLNLCHPREIPLNDTCVAEKKFNLGRGNAVVETYKLHR